MGQDGATRKKTRGRQEQKGRRGTGSASARQARGWARHGAEGFAPDLRSHPRLTDGDRTEARRLSTSERWSRDLSWKSLTPGFARLRRDG